MLPTLRARLHDTATAPSLATAMMMSKWVILLPTRPFTHDSTSVVAINGIGAIDDVPWPLGSVPIFLHGKDAVHGSGAVAVSCKPALIYTSRKYIFLIMHSINFVHINQH